MLLSYAFAAFASDLTLLPELHVNPLIQKAIHLNRVWICLVVRVEPWNPL